MACGFGMPVMAMYCFFWGGGQHKNRQNKVSEVGLKRPDTYQIANGLNFEHFASILQQDKDLRWFATRRS